MKTEDEQRAADFAYAKNQGATDEQAKAHVEEMATERAAARVETLAENARTVLDERATNVEVNMRAFKRAHPKASSAALARAAGLPWAPLAPSTGKTPGRQVRP